MGVRRKARECALQMLFQYDIARPRIDELIKTYWEEISDVPNLENQELNLESQELNSEISAPNSESEEPNSESPTPNPEMQEFASQLVQGTIAHLTEVDERISRRTENWRMSRMAIVDRNLLRLAVYEFLYQSNTPRTVVINEALEIARRFSTYEATQFINGILDAIKRDLEKDSCEAKTAKTTPSSAN